MFERNLQEECGILGFWSNSGVDAAELLYMGLFGIQHRGQQSAGIAVNDDGQIVYHKELGLVTEIFNDVVVRHLRGAKAGIAHCGYHKSSENQRENAQPLVMRYTKGQMAISYNGCLLNGHALRGQLEQAGFMFQSASDAETIAMLIAQERVKHKTIENAIVKVMRRLQGSYSFLVMTPHKIVAVRDGHGMKPLCIGQLADSYVFASETASIDTVGGKFLRDVLPGEVVVADDKGLHSVYTKSGEKSAMCIFEFVYLARTDSIIDGASVYQSRYEAGKVLASECHVDADVVVGVPDSGLPAALGFSRASGIPYAEGLIKNRYIGRTFIQPSQQMRETAVGLKLNALRSQVEGKRIVLVDDSIVRGTTSKKIVQMMKDVGGAREVHVRISSPPVKYPCFYGVDTPDKNVLIANRMTLDEIAKVIGADSLGFISYEGLLRTPVGAKCGFCSACFDGNYPLHEIKDGETGKAIEEEER